MLAIFIKGIVLNFEEKNSYMIDTYLLTLKMYSLLRSLAEEALGCRMMILRFPVSTTIKVSPKIITPYPFEKVFLLLKPSCSLLNLLYHYY